MVGRAALLVLLEVIGKLLDVSIIQDHTAQPVRYAALSQTSLHVSMQARGQVEVVNVQVRGGEHCGSRGRAWRCYRMPLKPMPLYA